MICFQYYECYCTLFRGGGRFFSGHGVEYVSVRTYPSKNRIRRQRIIEPCCRQTKRSSHEAFFYATKTSVGLQRTVSSCMTLGMRLLGLDHHLDDVLLMRVAISSHFFYARLVFFNLNRIQVKSSSL